MTRALRVLITNHMLVDRTGTEMYVHDLAKGLLAKGHTPIVFAPRLGRLARELSMATVVVVDDLSKVASPPDIIHGHHTLESAIALLQFPRTPAIYVCHDWIWEHDIPPRIPRIRQFVAVDHTIRDRLVLREGISDDLVSIVNNAVDQQRFLPRDALPAVPRRALVFSNYITAEQFAIIRGVCARQGISVDAVGANFNNVSSRPEKLIGQYDLVFAKGRCAWESLACGTSVIACDTWGLGPLITTQNLEFTRQRNFGRRLLQAPLSEEAIQNQLENYNATDAMEVSRRIRGECGLDRMLDRLIEIYGQAIALQESGPRLSPDDELRSLATLLHAWSRAKQAPTPEPFELGQVIRQVISSEIQGQPLRRHGFGKLAHSLKKRFLRWMPAKPSLPRLTSPLDTV